MCPTTGVNQPRRGCRGHPRQYFGLGNVNENILPILLRTFGYSRPKLVAQTLPTEPPKGVGVGRGVPLLHPPHSVVRPPNLELALTPLYSPTHRLHYMHVKTYIAIGRTLRSVLYVRMYASATSQIRLIYLCAAAVRLYD